MTIKQVLRILREQHVPWGAKTYARDLERRLVELDNRLTVAEHDPA